MTAALERAAQVEELWARRAVFADSMNADRMAAYVERRDLGRAWPSADEVTSRVVPVETRGATILLWPLRA